jgi:general stress protein 26
MAVTQTPVEQLNELIRDIKFAMFTTVHSNGSPHSRPMATRKADGDSQLWFFTDTNTDKVDAIHENNNVCVSYVDPDGQRYVSVSGTAQLLNNPEKKKEFWDPLYKAWFPRGLDDPKLVLIRVLINAAEYWDASQGKMVQLPGFAKATSPGEQYRAAGHRETEFPENQRGRNP